MTCALVALALQMTATAAPPTDSSFGVYADDRTLGFDGYARTSEYVPARDGVRLAIDVYRPMRRGVVAPERLPVVWVFTPYNRAVRSPDGQIVPPYEYARLLANGYAVAIADVRGKGASFGTRNGPADRYETNDAYDLTEWLARQPWSTGKIGMTGCSYFGATALQALRAQAPQLRAVFVGTTMFDQYATFAQGGIPAAGLLDDTFSAATVVEVDTDTDRQLLAQALREHEANTRTGRFFASTPFRDDVNPFTQDRWWETASFYPYLSQLRNPAGVYIYGGYYDLYADQTVYKFLNVKGAKLTFGPWPHCESPGFDMDAERLRFFDYWLKGVDNAVMREPAVHVYVSRAVDGSEWRALSDWPTQAPRIRYYLDDAAFDAPTERGAQKSLREATLSATAPGPEPAALRIAPPPSAGPIVSYGTAVAGVDPYSVTFTLPSQPHWREIIGSPVARLWISTDGADADIHVYLQRVRRNGGVEIISRGVLRASRRKTGPAPYDTGGHPWQTHRRADAQPLQPGVPAQLDIVLSPTAYAVRPGDRLRLAVTTRPPVPHSAPVPPVTLHLDAQHASYLELPDVDTRDQALNRAIDTTRWLSTQPRPRHERDREPMPRRD